MADAPLPIDPAALAAQLANAQYNIQNAAYSPAAAAAVALLNPQIYAQAQYALNQQDVAQDQANHDAAWAQPRNDNQTPSAAFLAINAQYQQQQGHSIESGGIQLNQNAAAHAAFVQQPGYVQNPVSPQYDRGGNPINALAVQEVAARGGQNNLVEPSGYRGFGDAETGNILGGLEAARPALAAMGFQFADKDVLTGDIIELQREKAYGTPSQLDDRFFNNQIQLWAEGFVTKSATYHHDAFASGVQKPANPFEYQGDLAVEFLKGAPEKSGDFFSPVSGLMSKYLPNGGLGVQQDAWNRAIAYDRGQPYNVQVSYANAVNFLNAAEGKYGPYGKLFGGVDNGYAIPEAVSGLPAGVAFTGSIAKIESVTPASPLTGIGIDPTFGMGVMAANDGTNIDIVYGSGKLFVAPVITPSYDIVGNLISGAKTAIIGMIPFVGADLIAYGGIQSEKARESEVNAQIVAQGPYEQRKDTPAALMSGVGAFVDTLTGSIPTYHGGLDVRFGEWTPIKSELTAYGQTGSPEVNAYKSQQAQITQESPAISVLADILAKDQTTRDYLMKGNVNTQGLFTGTNEQFTSLKELNAKDNFYADQINQFSTHIQNVNQQAISSGVLLGDSKGGYILNPDKERDYGAFSDVSNAFQKSMPAHATEGQLTAYEQTPQFQNAKPFVDPSLINEIATAGYLLPGAGPAIGFVSSKLYAPALNETVVSPQFGEGAYKFITNPEAVTKTAATGLELYILTAGLGEFAASSLPVAEVGTYSAITPSTRTAAMWQAPLTQAGIGAVFVGKGIYDIQTSDLSQASKSSAFGGLYGQLNVMGATAMYPELLAGAGSYGSVRFDVKPAYTELTLRQQTTLEPSVLMQSGLLSQDTVVAQIQRFATPSVGNALIDPIFNRIFNVRSEGNPTLLLDTDIGRTVDIGAFINAKGGGFDTIQGFGSTTRMLTARITETPDVWEATGTLHITGEYTEANPLELITQSKADESLTGKDWVDTTNELISASQKRTTDVTRDLGAHVTEGTTLQELLDIHPPVSGGTPFEYNVVTAAEHTGSLNTIIDYGSGRTSTAQLTRTPNELERLNTGEILTNTPLPSSRIIDFIDTHPEWNRLNAPEYAGVFNARGLPMTWERGEGGVSYVRGDVLDAARETYDMGGEYHLHTHPEYTLSEWLSGRMDTHSAAQNIQQLYADMPIVNKLNIRYEHDILPRVDYALAKAGLIDTTRPIATPSEQDLLVYSTGNVYPGSDMISAFIAAPRGAIEIREPIGGWQNYKEYLDRINAGATPHIQARNLGIAEPTQYYKNTPIDRSYVRSDVIDITETMHMESSPFNRMTHDALLRIARGNPEEEFYITRSNEPSLLNSGSNLGRNDFQAPSPELLQESRASPQVLSKVERSTSQPQIPRATMERGVAFVPEMSAINMEGAAPRSGNFNLMIASFGEVSLMDMASGQMQSLHQVTPQQISQPQVITPQFIQPQAQSVNTERGFAIVPDVMQVSRQEQEQQRDVSQIFGISDISALARISGLDSISSIEQWKTPIQFAGQLPAQEQQIKPIQDITPWQQPIQKYNPQPVIRPTGGGDAPPTPIPFTWPGLGGSGLPPSGTRRPRGPRHTEIFTYAPKNLKGLFGLPKIRTPAIKKRK